jgi:hypothetical protein
MGYDAPDALWDPRVGTTALAREGGQLLAADVNALNATRDGAGHITVFGHSYGSTTVADAAAGFGMKTARISAQKAYDETPLSRICAAQEQHFSGLQTQLTAPRVQGLTVVAADQRPLISSHRLETAL